MATREDIQVRVDIMQAWLDGKAIDYIAGSNKWEHLPYKDNANFDFNVAEYRIKPEPKEIWVNEQTSGTGGLCGLIYPSTNEAEEAADQHLTQRIAVHYREVIEDENR
jgi:hypothetical protein